MTRSRGALEAAVLRCLAAADRPLTANDVQFRWGESLAYTTVTTTLIRLHRKRALERRRVGRAFAYRMADDTRAAVTAEQLQRLMTASSDRTAVLSRFVAGLDVEDARLLADIIASRSPAS